MKNIKFFLSVEITVMLLFLCQCVVEGDPFTCPDSVPGLYPDPDQCDKYWKCDNLGSVRSNLCPDGLVFHPSKKEGEEPCDMVHNVPDRCKERSKLQKPKPG